ncbi:hypothetical protein [uncultured Flavobacterium sp.]|uniref:hypothetical protein n=1 Tax=uncultured Flavobacterium sp. TaxID=165435 RepID=UPI0025970358|nr:hypothetical protein [uncultured Flavobacterium sp.]
MQKVINCTYRGPRVFYLVSELYPYYAEESISASLQVLPGTMTLQIDIVLPTEELVIGASHLTSDLRTILRKFDITTGSLDGSEPGSSGNVDGVAPQLVVIAGNTLRSILTTHSQPADEDKLTATLTIVEGSTLRTVLVFHSQPSDEDKLTATLTIAEGSTLLEVLTTHSQPSDEKLTATLIVIEGSTLI